ncbi:unnamed protein product [Leptidea sinapis]|uniref:Uncharacterized protein n=1 Tax=Leptidea sinapis TaxID=189913 RepID=A0A5E4R301_9NEOP|nr:unnamed protein product [Leptidea sinapis]
MMEEISETNCYDLEVYEEWDSRSSLSQADEIIVCVIKVAGNRNVSVEPPRSTAYYYADLERIKRQNGGLTVSHNGRPADLQDGRPSTAQNGSSGVAQDSGRCVSQNGRENPDELSEYVETNEIFNDGAVKEIPPLRDRWAAPRAAEETYSTAGTFPMPEPKEKEPLLAELEIVGRVPLTQLSPTPGVRRTSSWYLCCPNVADDEISRESSWRYSSLRPVTAPPTPGQNSFHMWCVQAAERFALEVCAQAELSEAIAGAQQELEDEEVSQSEERLNMSEMETAVMMQNESGRDRRRRDRERHWLEAQPSETDL